MRRALLLLVLPCTLLASCSNDARRVAVPEVPPIAAGTAPQKAPTFEASIRVIDEAVLTRMGESWKPGCPVPRHDLRVLSLVHWGFDGAVHTDDMVVHESVANDIVSVFRKLFDAKFPIENMILADGRHSEDPNGPQRNATTGFNCRPPVGRNSAWSEHAYGLAVDINPVQNPRVSSALGVVPPEGANYLDRKNVRPGMIVAGDVVVRAFHAIGWVWGGTYKRSKDYHHFSLRGR